MNKQNEALKLALVAERVLKAWDDPQGMPALCEEMNALREALSEQPAQQPVSVTDELVNAYCEAWKQSFLADNAYHTVSVSPQDRKHIEAGLKAALAEQPAQQQEPVAFIKGRGWRDGRLEVVPAKMNQTFEIDQPLYTSPPASKPWAGLTDEETETLEMLYAPPVHPDFVNDADHCLELIRHVEAKLREKNA